ncbi:MAG: hypothetical protein HY751_09050 [Nitrospinae bacterium]|nr:hypothetical protein [Nitrospinota bacterium]
MKLRIPKKGWTAIHLAIIAWIAWVLAGAVAFFIGDVLSGSSGMSFTGVPSVSPMARKAAFQPEEDYTALIQRNIFNSAQSALDMSSAGQREFAASYTGGMAVFSAPKTSLGLRLVGTVIDPHGVYRLAAIEAKDTREQKLYKTGDTVLGARIAGILRNKVLLNRGGKLESLDVEFAEGPGGMGRAGARGAMAAGQDVNQISDTEYAVSKRYLDSQMAAMNQLLTEVRAVPNINKEGKTDGFKIFAIKKNSLFDKVGLQNQDVVKRINGIELNSAEKGLELFQALRNETTFNLDLERKTQKTSMRFTVQ